MQKNKEIMDKGIYYIQQITILNWNINSVQYRELKYLVWVRSKGKVYIFP